MAIGGTVLVIRLWSRAPVRWRRARSGAKAAFRAANRGMLSIPPVTGWRSDDEPRRQPMTVRRGRAARQTERLALALEHLPYLTRRLTPVEVVSAEGLEQIEHNADTLLEQVGIEVANDPEAVEIFRAGGADVTGSRVRFARG